MKPTTTGGTSALNYAELKSLHHLRRNGNDNTTGGLNQGGDVHATYTITAGNGNDTITGGSNHGAYSISVGDGNDTISGGANIGSSFSVVNTYSICAGIGNDTIVAGSNLFGGIYSITVGNGNDPVTAGGGNSISLGNGTDTIDMATAIAATGDTISSTKSWMR